MSISVAASLTKRLKEAGLIDPRDEAAVLQIADQVTRPDYIPDGPSVVRCGTIRPARPGCRCGKQTDHDIQSGPIYCGCPAEFEAIPIDREGNLMAGMIFVCGRHKAILEELYANKSE